MIEKQVTNAQGKVVLIDGKPIIKKYRPTFSDVAADPGRFNLSPKQLTAIDSVIADYGFNNFEGYYTPKN